MRKKIMKIKGNKIGWNRINEIAETDVNDTHD